MPHFAELLNELQVARCSTREEFDMDHERHIIPWTHSVLMMLILLVNTGIARALPLGLPQAGILGEATETDATVRLGKQLFFDSGLSADRTVSCATCHQPEHAFSDARTVSQGIRHQKGARNTPGLLNVVFNAEFTWDGRQPTLEAQALEPILNPREQGLRNEAELVERIRRNPNYVIEFRRAFSLTSASITPADIGRAIAAYERTLISADSPLDRFLYGGDTKALSASAQRGLGLFRGAARCATCHSVGDDYALFTDNSYHTVSVGMRDVGPKLSELTARVVKYHQEGIKIDRMLRSDPSISELGRFVVTLDPKDIGKFRTPSLRNVALTAPYMHNGSVATLSEAVERELYDHAGELPIPLILTPQEKEDLVNFLEALTGKQSR